MKIIKNIFLNSIFIAIVFTIIYFMYNYKIYIIASGSMQPTYKIGEMIITQKKKEKEKYNVGDVITFHDKDFGADVTHRIVEILDNEYYTKGDFNNISDINPVKQEDIIGKVVFNSFEFGYIYMNYKYHITCLVIFTIIVLNMIFTKSHNKEIKEERE